MDAARAVLVSALSIAAALASAPAQAQRTDQNATTQSNDAFGRSVGTERSGLYSSSDVRGFNPVEAGNVRMQGLYFDLIDLLSARLIEGITVRVGIASQRYPFPAPTGLVDHGLTISHDRAELSIEPDYGNTFVRGPGLAVDFKLPLQGERLGLAGGVAGREATRPDGGQHRFRTYAAVLAFRPGSDSEFLLFTSRLSTRSEEARATYFPAGDALPPQVPRGDYLGLDWTQKNTVNSAHGAIAKLPLGTGLRLEAGLFQSRRHQETSFSDFLLGVQPDGGAARRLVIADAGNIDESLSGELRLVREWSAGPFAHALTASIRGRKKDRLFGGSVPIDLGPVVSIFEHDTRPAPDYVLGAKNRDHVRQLTAGLAYSLFWQGRASLDFGLSWSNYRKSIEFADPALAATVTRDKPVVWNVAASFALAHNLILFGGVSRGQEDALVAPDIATNRAEAPPAIRTRQVEAGVRLGITRNLGLVVGLFSISKPYFNLDPALRYRQLGRLTNRGVEVSLTGRLAPGLSIVGGALWLDPRISGEAVDSGVIGKRPVGQVRLRSAVNLDWRTQGGKGAWSFDLAFESFSARTANTQNTLSAPARCNLNLGARYRFSAGNVKMVLRPQITNVFDHYGWQVSPIGGFTYANQRSGSISLLADF